MMDSPKPVQIILLVLVVALAAVGWNLQTQLQAVRADNAQLREALRTQVACAPVEVTCVCPEYEEGWDDAEFAEGCDPAGIPIDDLEFICAELEEFGYVPRC